MAGTQPTASVKVTPNAVCVIDMDSLDHISSCLAVRLAWNKLCGQGYFVKLDLLGFIDLMDLMGPLWSHGPHGSYWSRGSHGFYWSQGRPPVPIDGILDLHGAVRYLPRLS